MESLDYWRLCDELSVFHAALLIAGEDPSSASVYVEEWNIDKRPTGYEAAKTALLNAISGKRLVASIRYSSREPNYKEDPSSDEEIQRDADGNMLFVKKYPDMTLTTVQVEDLRSWLAGRGLKTGFFFPEPSDGQDYLNANHPHYSPKLAAAVEAWRAVSSGVEPVIKGKTVKQTIDKWVRKHAAEFDLTDEDGNPVNNAVEAISTVANWDTKGGAPKQ